MICSTYYVCHIGCLPIMCYSEQPRYTAARECFEETLGVLGGTDHLASLLENCQLNNVFEVSASAHINAWHIIMLLSTSKRLAT